MTESLRELLKVFKTTQKFRDLKMIELLFYCRIPNKYVANLFKMIELLFYCRIPNKYVANLFKLKEISVRVFKHRCLKRIRENITKFDTLTNLASSNYEYFLTEIWESHRLSCPKRSTLGAFLLETLEPRWFDYVDFHLTTLGCHFCRANLKDLKRDEQRLFRKRIMESTVGFLSSS
jgi:hypothetical protein